MELLTCQLVALVVLVIIRVGAIVLPVVYTCRDNTAGKPQWVHLAMCLCFSLAGGVVLATCFVHLMPQVRAALHFFLPQHTLPITELLVIAGFFITFFLDEVFISYCSNSKVHPESVPSTQSLSPITNIPRPTGLRTTILSFHGLAKGMAVGLADSPWDTWFLLATSAIHDVVSGVEFSLHLIHNHAFTWLVIAMAALGSFAVVAGMGLGTLLTFLEVDALVVAVLRGLAAGNLLYLSVYELLTRKIRAKACGLISYLFALMGFLLMLALQMFGLQDLKYPEAVPSCVQETSFGPDFSG